MDNRVIRWLDNVPLDNPLQRRQASMLQLVLLAWILLAVLGGLALVLIPRPATLATLSPAAVFGLILLLLATGMLVITPIVALVLLRRGRFSDQRECTGDAACRCVGCQAFATASRAKSSGAPAQRRAHAGARYYWRADCG